MVITATYSANLIAFLSVEKYRVPFNNLAQLASQEEYKFGTLGGTAQMLHVKVKKELEICDPWFSLKQSARSTDDESTHKVD